MLIVADYSTNKIKVHLAKVNVLDEGEMMSDTPIHGKLLNSLKSDHNYLIHCGFLS